MQIRHQKFSTFIKNFEETLRYSFHEKADIDTLSLKRGLPAEVWNRIMAGVPLSVAIPEEFGGRGGKVKECLGLLAASSYESLALSLTFGINFALFLEPLAKYGNRDVKQGVFDRFLHKQNIGGLMITEPDYGSDALNMKTSYREVESGYQIQGSKHWQGLTGMANYWLVASRKQLPSGSLARDIDFFVCDTTQEKQKVVVEEVFDNAGLFMIPYGLNRLNIEVPSNYKLQPESSGIKMMLDILHRSRMQFPGMGLGFVKRMLDEAISHCRSRIVGASNLLSRDQVQFSISRIQAAYTMCSALCVFSSDVSGIEHNLATENVQANSIKTVVTDLMQEAAQVLAQLSGANGFKIQNIGGRGIMDTRPFQIFEGPNDMLYSQIACAVTKLMKKQRQPHLYRFLEQYELTSRACVYFKSDLNVCMDSALSQRKMVDLGRILGRVVCAGYVLELQEKGFRRDLVENCLTMVKQEVASLASSLRFKNAVAVVEDYSEDSAWMEYA